MAEWLTITAKYGKFYVDLRQMAGRTPKGEIFCRSCEKTQPAFKPAQAWGKKGETRLIWAPEDRPASSCAVCGWLYERRTISRKLRFDVIDLDKGECVYCGLKDDRINKNLTLDHVVPESKGGENTIENLVLCCHYCNSSKGNRENVLKPRFGRFRGQRGTWQQEIGNAQLEKAYWKMPEEMRALSPNGIDRWCMKTACEDLGIEPPTEDELQAMWPLHVATNQKEVVSV